MEQKNKDLLIIIGLGSFLFSIIYSVVYLPDLWGMILNIPEIK